MGRLGSGTGKYRMWVELGWRDNDAVDRRASVRVVSYLQLYHL
jgi:hypothetical protein